MVYRRQVDYKKRQVRRLSYAPISPKAGADTGSDTAKPNTKKNSSSSSTGFEAGFKRGYKESTGKDFRFFDGEKFSITYLEADLEKHNVAAEDLAYTVVRYWAVAREYVGEFLSETPSLRSFRTCLRDLIEFHNAYMATGRNIQQLMFDLGMDVGKKVQSKYTPPKKEDIADMAFLEQALCQ